MNRLHTSIITGGLLVSPILLTVNEVVRTTATRRYVENDSDPLADATSHLQAVADHPGLWHTAAYLNLAFVFTWAIALLAVTVLVGRTQPLLSAVTGLLGLASVVGAALHWAFYYLTWAALAQTEGRDLAAHAALSFADAEVLQVVTIAVFLIGTLLAVLAASFGLWRAHALSWWGAAGLILWVSYVLAGPEAPLAGLINLALLIPFVGVARRLATVEDTVSEPEPSTA